MSRSRIVLAILGGTAAALGTVIVVAPGLAASLAVPRIPVAVIGGLAGLFALVVGMRRRGSTIDGAEPPMVETVDHHPVPGATFDTQLRHASGLGIDDARHRRENREHLAAVAVDVLVVAEGWTPAEAEAALADGTWTDDPIAAACFTGDAARVDLRAIVSEYLDRRSRYEREFVHAVDALQAHLDGEVHP